MRSALAAVACTLSVSLISTTTPAIAQEDSSAIAQLQDALAGGNSVASLAGAIADAQEEVSRLESEIGEFRERANQALVDLQDARNLSEQARRGTATARGELDDAQLEVEDAQEKLDEFSRSAYRRANTSEAVTNAAGGDAREDMLTRQSYLRTQAEKQESTVAELEKVRTQKSNKESQLRKSEQLAIERESNAESAENDAREVLQENHNRIGQISTEREQLVALQDEAQDALSSVRGNDEPATDPVSTEKAEQTEEAEESTSTQESEEVPTSGSAQQLDEETSAHSEPASEASGESSAAPTESSEVSALENYSAASAPAGAGQVSPTGSEPAATNAGTAVDQASSLPSQKEEPTANENQGAEAQGSSVDSEQATQLAGLAVGAAAAIVAASQPAHSVDSETGEQSDTESSGDVAAQDEGSSEAMISGSSALFPQQGPTQEDQTASELDGILEELPTAEDIEDEASDELGDASRSAKIDAVIARAESQIGVPYAWGGGDANGPTKGIRDGGVADSHGDYNKVGFDCSGLTLYAFAGAGMSLPHFTGYQYNQGEKIDPQEMERGDLIFYGPSGNNHVAIYQGNGMMIEAPQSGETVASVPVRWSGMSDYAVRLI